MVRTTTIFIVKGINVVGVISYCLDKFNYRLLSKKLGHSYYNHLSVYLF